MKLLKCPHCGRVVYPSHGTAECVCPDCAGRLSGLHYQDSEGCSNRLTCPFATTECFHAGAAIPLTPGIVPAAVASLAADRPDA